jgi:type IV pilus assembly protein PilV
MRINIHSSGLQKGMTLIDLLVAVILFSIGILGLVGMQIVMTKVSISSENRATAALLADELVADYQMYGSVAAGDAAVGAAWKTKVTSKLPSGAGTSAVDATGAQLITITWQEPGKVVNGTITQITDSYFTKVTVP